MRGVDDFAFGVIMSLIGLSGILAGLFFDQIRPIYPWLSRGWDPQTETEARSAKLCAIITGTVMLATGLLLVLFAQRRG
jgi:hypothetical protein